MNYLIPLLLILIVACEPQKDETFSLKYINPASGYSQSVSVINGSTTTIYVSGQVGEGEDLATQMTAALENLRLELNAAGATFNDIVKMNTYIVDYQPEDLAVFRDTRKAIMGDKDMPASTLVGVTSLALPEWEIEIEAIAVIKR